MKIITLVFDNQNLHIFLEIVYDKLKKVNDLTNILEIIKFLVNNKTIKFANRCNLIKN